MSREIFLRLMAAWFGLAAIVFAAETPARFIGTISMLSAESGTAEVKDAAGETISIHLIASTVFQRVGAGEKSLKNAQPISAGDILPGDRVLVNLEPGTTEALRLVVMAATDISKRDEADREAWTTQGVGGVVTGKDGNVLTLRARAGQAVAQVEVTVSAKTTFRKYAPDSVSFADAKSSSLDSVQIGDQLRARGDKSVDGSKVAAGEVVFGSFVTKAGTITAVDAGAKTLTITEINSGKTLKILIAPGSQVKAMPDFAAMGGPPPPGATAPGKGMPGPGMPDPARMIEMMPAATLASFKPGQSVVVSSTRGANPDELTAIVLLGNAEMLIRMASMGGPAAASGQKQQNAGNAMPNGTMGGMSGGLELPAMMP
jgi:hypothetical protein